MHWSHRPRPAETLVDCLLLAAVVATFAVLLAVGYLSAQQPLK